MGFRNVLDLEIRYIFIFLFVLLINVITVLDMNIYIVMKLKKIIRIFKIWLLFIEKYIFYKFEYYDIVVEKYYCFLNMLLLKRIYIKCMYMYEVIFLYVLFMYFWICILCRGRYWKEKYFVNIVYVVRKRTNYVYLDVSSLVLYYLR